MVSVITCAYNGEKYIRQCLDSVLNQTAGLKDIELVIIDDASTDSTVEILKEYESRYPENICLILREVNSRETTEFNWNLALSYASGEYILFLDQDDWYEPEAVELLTKLMQEHPDLDYIGYGKRIVNADGQQIRVWGSKENEGDFFEYRIENEDMRIDYAISGILPGATPVWAHIYKKAFLVENRITPQDGQPRAGFGDNFFAGMRVLYATRFGYLDRILINYRKYIGSSSHDTVVNSKVTFKRCDVGIVFYD